MQIYWIFLMCAIFLAVFSDKIDRAAKANKKLKRWLIVLCIILALVSVVLIIKSVRIIT